MAAVKKFSLSLSFVVCLTFTRFAFIEAMHEDALIKHLPGFDGTFPSKHYSGYVNVDTNIHLFYYFVLSERNPEKDPVVLWLNGGPGCSSFDGFVYEHGPFNFKEGIPKGSLPTLHHNPYSWSKVSNIIYLDSPVGVGLSYSKGETKYMTSDTLTAINTHTFLVKWFELYPELIKNPFYISGQSYAGVYIPTLALRIDEGMKNDLEPKINFKGYIIGNAVVADIRFGNDFFMSYIHGMGLISNNIFEDIQSTCYGKNIDGEKCLENLEKSNKLVADLNRYNILEPRYDPPKYEHETIKRNTTLMMREWMFNQEGLVSRWTDSDPPYISIDDEIASAWLNDEEVRKAIHAKPVDVIGHWEICSKIKYERDAGTMIPYHKNLTRRGYSVLIYSGDHDMAVPFTGTQAWVRSLGYDIVDEWRPWMVNGQVAGFLQGYDHKLTFMTIKGAGHSVPKDKPEEALHFYSNWLEGKPI